MTDCRFSNQGEEREGVRKREQQLLRRLDYLAPISTAHCRLKTL
jgi:hypothetical protein